MSIQQTSPAFDFVGTATKNHVDLKPVSIETLQLNITKLCNQACVHCHVDSSPRRREMASYEVLAKCIEILRTTPQIQNLDITGGAPELHPGFTEFVIAARSHGKNVMVRHNLTVALDPHPITKESMEYIHGFFAEQKVEVISSLPYYQQHFTDKQRGDGVFQKSIESLQRLNRLGYGLPGTGLKLNLVYNPVGPFLPAPQAGLEADYKKHLRANFGIEFNSLYAITNMPIHRFKAQLVVSKTYEDYMEKLVSAFNPTAANGVMCKSLISVSYDGKLYDCDFNQMLGLAVGEGAPVSIFDFDYDKLLRREIVFKDHCFGCTAGAGSSCGGNTTASA
jgi:radical SAM/Cys-rich protein